MLKDTSVQQYIQTLSSHAPTPGGGSSLALVACNALSLCEMALNVTINKRSKSNQPTGQLQKVAKQFNELKEQTLAIIDGDAQSFDNILTAMRLPKDTEQEKQQRTAQLQQCYEQSALLCLSLMQICVDGYTLADLAIEYADKFVVSDAHIGKALLKTTAQCCQYNVDVNVQCLADTNLRQELEEQKHNLLTTVK